MSDTDEVEKLSTNDTDTVGRSPAADYISVEIADKGPDNEEQPQPEPEKIVKSYSKRSDKTKAELKKDAKQRAIDNFQRGIPDPEFRVVKLNSGKYRCYPRKEPLQPEPIKLNQVAINGGRTISVSENKKSEEITASADNAEITKPKTKGKDPFADIVYYNMSNQISEQLNKRLDAVNLELERLRHKNSKLKGKYKQLKQAIYITEEEDVKEDKQEQQATPASLQQQQQSPQQQQQSLPPMQAQQSLQQSIQPTKRINAINFNRFFN